MRIPSQENIELPLLKVLEEAGGSLSIRDAIIKTKEKFPKLTDEDKASVLASGRNRLNNRIAWVRQKLVARGDINSSAKGVWAITEQGKRRLKTEWASWHAEYHELIPRATTEMPHSKVASKAVSEEKIAPNPEEVIDSARQKIIDSIKAQIIAKLKEMDPAVLENVIAQLLERLGYGSIEEGSIKVTGGPGDYGIDGIFRLDKIGLKKAIFQAKRWNGNVGNGDVDRLSGSMHAVGVEVGILVTTSDFTPSARHVAAMHKNIMLINGNKLAELMINVGLGVKKIPVDYPIFEEEFFDGLS